MQNISPPLISDETAKGVRQFLKKILNCESGSCIFRRFGKLIKHSEDVKIFKHLDPQTVEILPSLENISKKEMEKNIEIVYSSFSGITLPIAVRQEPVELENKYIYIQSSNYAQIDFGCISPDTAFCFTDRDSLGKAVTPLHNDLLFIYISDTTLNKWLKNISSNNYPKTSGNKSKKLDCPKADKWCIISEQFLRMWTLVMYDWHETFDKIISSDTAVENREKALRDKLFKGNRLMTNSWLKRNLSVDMSIEESREKFWFRRTELSSKYVDIYTAIILIVRYCEIPCYANIPVHFNSESCKNYDRDFWHLPEKFLSTLFFLSRVKLYVKEIKNYSVWASKFLDNLNNFDNVRILKKPSYDNILNFLDKVSHSSNNSENLSKIVETDITDNSDKITENTVISKNTAINKFTINLADFPVIG
jgi:hypothetical protein